MKTAQMISKTLATAAAFTLLAVPAMAGGSNSGETLNTERVASASHQAFEVPADFPLLARGGNGGGGKGGGGNGGGGNGGGGNGGGGNGGGGNGPGDGTGDGGSGPRDGSGNGPGTGICPNV
jgi:hypothetical protein